MDNVAFEPLSRRIISVRKGVGVKADLQEICDFTLEQCLLNSSSGEKGEVERLCPFTLEPVCMKTRGLSAGMD